jgi:O-antigen biosynthesis protein
MDLSIIIVNYNVKHFLEQCLHSVEKATGSIESEIFVVDNNSVDGSCQMVYEKFPNVTVIANKTNLGFAKANNQAIKLATGRYVLLLNPDTFVQEDTLKKCLEFCDSKSDAGGLGVKMIDGKGNFLAESKRSLPTPSVAFYKIFGLSTIFSKSRIFGKYHLSFLDKDKIHKIEILAGAFMWLRKSVLDEIGLLDEAFFMYGEDIDLSYRIIKAGYSNYYFPETTIIHYKGESTKKGSINYVMVFYKAMIIFAKKHFSAKNAWIYILLINLAVYFRAAIGIIRRVVSGLFTPVLDFLLIFLGFYFLTPLWEQYHFGIAKYYPIEFYLFVIPSYILAWLFFVYLLGGYEKRVKPFALFRAVLSGSLFILVIYALLPESLRFSRALLILGSIWSVFVIFFVRLSASLLFKETFKLQIGAGKKKIAVIGSEAETQRVIAILKESGVIFDFTGRIANTGKSNNGAVLGDINQIEEIIKINKIDEIVFCSQDIAASEIIETMLSIKSTSTDFKIAPPESVSVIGSNSINTAGDLYVIDINSLSKGVNKRKKRMFDILSGIGLLVFSPVLVFIVKRPRGFITNCIKVIIGKYTWVGITFEKQPAIHHAELKTGVLSPIDGLKDKSINSALVERINVMYAKDYKVINDFVILAKSISLLGKQV